MGSEEHLPLDKNVGEAINIGSLPDFLATNAPISSLIRKSSPLGYRKLTFMGFFKGFFTLRELIVLMLPAKFSAQKRRYLSKQLDFLNQEAKYELSKFFSRGSGLFGKPFIGPSYLMLGFIKEAIVSDQYHAKQFVKNNSVIIDAGANIGTFSVFAANLAPEGKIYAFEPVKDTFLLLKENTKTYQNVSCINSGLGDVAATKNIFNKGIGDGGNVMQDSPFYKRSEIDDGAWEPVVITTIDEFVSQNKILRVDFIKIDTEGYEAKILQGARKIIEKYQPVIAMSAYHNPEDKKKLPEILKSICPRYVCELHQEQEEDLICFVPKT
jgi:FkbM family methyltransferase